MKTLIGRIFLVVIISASLSQQGCGGPDLENEKVGLSEENLEFIEIVSSTREEYEKAENELQKTQVRKKRMQSFESLWPIEHDDSFSNWKGEMVDMGTTSDQRAWLYIRPLGIDNVLIQTLSNALSDHGTGSLISTDSPIYDAVSTLSKGDIVYFSAMFTTPDGDKDYFEDVSLTENGSMTEPGFVVKFKCVKKVADGPCE
jgi:hypothetical protein